MKNKRYLRIILASVLTVGIVFTDTSNILAKIGNFFPFLGSNLISGEDSY